MKRIAAAASFAALFAAGVGLAACGGPSQQQLAETPAATAPPRPVEAPPASTSDKDRERAVQQFEDMQTTQQAHREARGSAANPPTPTPTGTKPAAQQPPAKPKKKGPAIQAPAED